MMKNRRLLETKPDKYFEDDIRRLYQTSSTDDFIKDFDGIYVFNDCIQISLTQSDYHGSPLSIGTQCLIKFDKSFAIGEISKIEEDFEVRILYLRLIKRSNSYPEWRGSFQILKVRIYLIHYNTAVYRKIMSCFNRNQLKNAQNESRKQNSGFQAFRALMSGRKGPNLSTFTISEDDSISTLQKAIQDAYLERQTFIFCTPSTDRLYELATFCNDDSEMSKQTIVFPPGMFCAEKWKSESLKNIKVHQADCDMTADSWNIERIEHGLNFRGSEAIDLMKEIHPRIIMGTPASLILVMQGLDSHYCTYRDRLPKRILFDQGHMIPDVFALILLSTFPTIEQCAIFNQNGAVPVKYGENTGSLADMAR